MIFDAHCADVSVFLPVWSLGGCISALAAGGYTHIHDRTSKQTEEFKPACIWMTQTSGFWRFSQSYIWTDTFSSPFTLTSRTLTHFHTQEQKTHCWHWLCYIHFLNKVYILQYYFDTSPNLYIDLCSFLMFGK